MAKAYSFCPMCILKCGMELTIEKGKIVHNQGMKEHVLRNPCIKSKGLIDWVYSPKRLKYPLKRKYSGWEKLTWEDVLDEISRKLQEIKKSEGPGSLAVHLGPALFDTQVDRLARRFCDAFGTPNFSSSEDYCYYSRVIGSSLTFNFNGRNVAPSFRGSRCVLLWGWNPEESSSPTALQAIISLKNKGAYLIVIDPRRTKLAHKADFHLQPKPGTDVALALGMINYIVEKGLFDKEFVENWTIGFNQLKAHIKKYPLEEVSNITGIKPQAIQEIAKVYATNKPASIALGLGLEQSINGVQAVRAISILIGITGNFDVLGGNRCLDPGLKDMRILGRIDSSSGIGAHYPLFRIFTGQDTGIELPRAILDRQSHPPVRALILQASNSIITTPDSNKISRALDNLDLLVVMDLFMTETAKKAHYVLPAVSFPEADFIQDYWTYNFPLIMVAEKAIEPIGNSRSDGAFWLEMAKRLGLNAEFPWRDEREVIEYLLSPHGFTIDSMKERKGILFYQKRKEKQYLQEGFNTPTRKMEIYSQTLEKYGYDPLPTYRKQEEDDTILRNFPFTLISGPRVKSFTHSRHHRISSMRKRIPAPFVEIPKKTAEELSLCSGQKVKVETPMGFIIVEAKITEDILPGVVSIPSGWPEANVNLITDDTHRDPISGYPALRTIPCKITPA